MRNPSGTVSICTNPRRSYKCRVCIFVATAGFKLQQLEPGGLGKAVQYKRRSDVQSPASRGNCITFVCTVAAAYNIIRMQDVKFRPYPRQLRCVSVRQKNPHCFFTKHFLLTKSNAFQHNSAPNSDQHTKDAKAGMVFLRLAPWVKNS